MYKISLAVFNRMLYIVTIQVHVYGETPYMNKSKAAKQRFCECGSE